MRIAVIGAGGRLGAALGRHFLARGDEVLAWRRADLDLRDPKAIRAALANASFDVLINSAALTSVDYCETHPDEAKAVNGGAVATMAEVCEQQNARLMQISTDYVFDGEQTEPYRETDEPRPLSIYGESKRAGELHALAAADRNLVVRVSWVYGPDRPAFPDMIVRRALAEEQVEAISDKVSSPSSSLELAQGIEALLEEGATGLVHLCDAGSCTWQEYGQAALDAALAAGLPLKARRVDAIALSQMTSFVARRPAFTALTTERFTEWTRRKPRPWREPLGEYIGIPPVACKPYRGDDDIPGSVRVSRAHFGVLAEMFFVIAAEPPVLDCSRRGRRKRHARTRMLPRKFPSRRLQF